MAKAPSFQFYPGDWLRDTALRSCSLLARGLWMDMLCIMHQGEPYGHLTVNGQPIDAVVLSRMVGGTPKSVGGCLAELEAVGVFKRTDDGVIYSKRMVEDERVRRSRAAGGSLGGNPSLKDNPKVGKKVNLTANLQPTPSSSSASAPSSAPSGDHASAQSMYRGVWGDSWLQPPPGYQPPPGMVRSLDLILGVLQTDDPDQLGFLAQLAHADAAKFDIGLPLLDYVGRAKAKGNPAGYIRAAIKAQIGVDRWADFVATTPSPGYCQSLIAQEVPA